MYVFSKTILEAVNFECEYFGSEIPNQNSMTKWQFLRPVNCKWCKKILDF